MFKINTEVMEVKENNKEINVDNQILQFIDQIDKVLLFEKINSICRELGLNIIEWKDINKEKVFKRIKENEI